MDVAPVCLVGGEREEPSDGPDTRLQALLGERQRHIQQLTIRHSATISQLNKNLADLHAKNVELKADALRWENTALQALEDNRLLREQLEQKSARVFELEAQVQTMQAQSKDSLHFRSSLSSLNHELALWEERGKQESHPSSAELEETRRQALAHEALASALNEQLHALHAKHHTLQALYEEMKERAERADRERKEKCALTDAQKQMLEYHKQISLHKLHAVEGKYAALKKAHVGLERHLVLLEAEAEKHRLLRRKMGLLPGSTAPAASAAADSAAAPPPPPHLEDSRQLGRARSSTWHSIHPVATGGGPALVETATAGAHPQTPHPFIIDALGVTSGGGEAGGGGGPILSASAPSPHEWPLPPP